MIGNPANVLASSSRVGNPRVLLMSTSSVMMRFHFLSHLTFFCVASSKRKPVRRTNQLCFSFKRRIAFLTNCNANADFILCEDFARCTKFNAKKDFIVGNEAMWLR